MNAEDFLFEDFSDGAASAAPTADASSPTSPSLSGVRIATMTASFKMNQPLNLRVVAIGLPGGNVVYDPHSRAFNTARGKAKRSFHNQATVELRVFGHKVSTCLFSNGSVKLAGCRDDIECHRAADVLISKLQRVRVALETGEEATAVPDPANLSWNSLKVVMRKGDANIGYKVALQSVADLLQQTFPMKFEPRKYNAVRVTVPLGESRHVSVIVYESGKLAVMGNSTERELNYAVDLVGEALRPLSPFGSPPQFEPEPGTRLADFLDGLPENQLIELDSMLGLPAQPVGLPAQPVVGAPNDMNEIQAIFDAEHAQRAQPEQLVHHQDDQVQVDQLQFLAAVPALPGAHGAAAAEGVILGNAGPVHPVFEHQRQLRQNIEMVNAEQAQAGFAPEQQRAFNRNDARMDAGVFQNNAHIAAGVFDVNDAQRVARFEPQPMRDQIRDQAAAFGAAAGRVAEGEQFILDRQQYRPEEPNGQPAYRHGHGVLEQDVQRPAEAADYFRNVAEQQQHRFRNGAVAQQRQHQQDDSQTRRVQNQTLSKQQPVTPFLAMFVSLIAIAASAAYQRRGPAMAHEKTQARKTDGYVASTSCSLESGWNSLDNRQLVALAA